MIDWPALLVDLPDSTTLMDMLKLHMGIEDTAQDAALSRALNTAGPIVEMYCDKALAMREVVENFPHHFGTVTLQNLPAIAPLVVTLNGVEQDDYVLWTGTGGLAHVSRTGWPRDVPMDWRGFDQVSVSYTAGYDPLPVTLATGIVWTAGTLFDNEGTGTPATGGGGDISRMTIADVGSISYTTGGDFGSMTAYGPIPATARELLQPFRRITI